MNKRLVWNFELNSLLPINLRTLNTYDKDLLRWEKRFFWPETSIITLNNIDSSYLSFADCKIKQRVDDYYLLTNASYNLKQRQGNLLYKPCLQIKDKCLGFGKKIDLSTCAQHENLPGFDKSETVNQLFTRIQKEKITLLVEKTAFIFTLPTTPRIKLELARLCLHGQYYFTVCVEGYSYDLVHLLSDHLLKQSISCDYVSFLKQHQ